jgi:hypothetical protein
MIKTKSILWLAVAALPVFTAGCPVDVNEGTPPDGGGTGGAECPATERNTVRIFHGAGGTPVTRPEFGPATTRNLTIVRPDAPGGPATVASLVAGRAALVQFCSGKQINLIARLAGSMDARAMTSIMLPPPPAMASPLDAAMTLVLAGISDALKPDGTPENPASMTDPLRFIEVPDMFSTGTDTEVQVVHASRRTPTPIDVDPNPATPASEGPDITGLARYEASNVVGTRGSPDTDPSPVSVTFTEGGATRASFSIAPRIPAGAKALLILFDTEIFDPNRPASEPPVPAPVARLFVTGDDPLLGGVAGGGVQF